MNTPIDARMGDRRQKALRARLASMAQQNNSRAKALLGKLGQSRGRVQAAGPRGGGSPLPRNGMVRPGALNFLRGSIGPEAGRGAFFMDPEMRPQPGPVNRHAPPGALPTSLLPPALPTEGLPVAGMPAAGLPAAGLPEPTNPAEVALSDPAVQQTIEQNKATYPTSPIGWTDPLQGLLPAGGVFGGPQKLSNELVPLGDGRYYNPATGVIHGGGFGHTGI